MQPDWLLSNISVNHKFPLVMSSTLPHLDVSVSWTHFFQLILYAFLKTSKIEWGITI